MSFVEPLSFSKELSLENGKLSSYCRRSMDDTTPATKADIAELKAATKADIAELKAVTKADLAQFVTKADLKKAFAEFGKEVEKGFTSLSKTIDQALLIMSNVDKRHTDTTKDHGKRIRKLEKFAGFPSPSRKSLASIH